MALARQKLRIGDMLVAAGEITEDQLKGALAAQQGTGRKLGRVLVERGDIDEDRLLGFLSRQLGVPFIDLSQYNYRRELVARLPETHARRYRAIVLDDLGSELLVGMADPMDIFGYDEVARILDRPIALAVVRETELLSTLDQVYRRTDEIASFAVQLEGELSSDAFDMSRLTATDEDTSSPVARLLHSILEDAVQIRASDVHIEPDEDALRIRQRVDGVLQEQVIKESRIAAALVSRLKLMAGLDISEKRLPQDGRFQINTKGRDIDVRLSTLPVQHGESMVMRLLDQKGGVQQLENVGMQPPMLARFRRLIGYPNGLVLVTGPTGSGKTTTLYGALTELNRPDVKIITAEDPVEFQLPRVNQVQINTKIGLTFATVLRATLRQDPDVLLVGEIRDKDTAEIAMRAAMTGHLVLSTLHTNDAISTAMRLLDIGIEGYLAAAALRGIVAQRLVRRICEGCRQALAPTPQQLAFLHGWLDDDAIARTNFQHGRGCARCQQTGYRGRVGVFELLTFDVPLADALRRNDAESFARIAREQQDYEPLLANALRLATEGVTSLAEVIELAGDDAEGPLAGVAAANATTAAADGGRLAAPGAVPAVAGGAMPLRH
jgi:MSHA biogenesis protein MshE